MITTNRNNERKKKRSIFLTLQLLEISARDDQGFIVQILITWNFCFCLRIFLPTACISRMESKYLFLRAKVLLYGYGVARCPNPTKTNSSISVWNAQTIKYHKCLTRLANNVPVRLWYCSLERLPSIDIFVGEWFMSSSIFACNGEARVKQESTE